MTVPKAPTFEDLPPEIQEAFPHLDKIMTFVASFQRESPRGAVLISSGYLEERLKEILRAFFLGDKNSNKLLDSGDDQPKRHAT